MRLHGATSAKTQATLSSNSICCRAAQGAKASEAAASVARVFADYAYVNTP